MTRRHFAALVLALTAAAGGCGGPGRGEGTAGGQGPREQVELSTEERALMAAYDEGGEAWSEARAVALADPLLERFLVDQLVLRMVRAYDGLASPGGGDRGAEFERAQAELVRLGESSAGVLTGLLALSDGVVAALAGRTLERIGRPALEPVVRLLDADAATARRRAAEVLVKLPHAGEREPDVRARLVSLLLDDPEWIVRAQAALAVGARGARDRLSAPWRQALERALADPDPAVVRAATEGLASLGDPLAVPALVQMLARAVNDGDLRLVRLCQGALRAVTGETRDLDLQGWQDWWYAHRDELRASGR